MNVDRVSLPLLAKDGEHMIVVALHGEAYEATIGNQIDLYGPMATALRENRLVHSKPQQGLMKSIMVAPLFVAGRAIGTINIGNKSETAFGIRDESLLLQIASLLAARIENLRLFTDAQARAERERRVRTITDKIHQATNREAILQIAREEISQLLGASQSAVQLGTQRQLLSAQETNTTPPDSNNGKGNSS
jgi:GAF domain-containing protein